MTQLEANELLRKLEVRAQGFTRLYVDLTEDEYRKLFQALSISNRITKIRPTLEIGRITAILKQK